MNILYLSYYWKLRYLGKNGNTFVYIDPRTIYSDNDSARWSFSDPIRLLSLSLCIFHALLFFLFVSLFLLLLFYLSLRLPLSISFRLLFSFYISLIFSLYLSIQSPSLSPFINLFLSFSFSLYLSLSVFLFRSPNFPHPCPHPLLCISPSTKTF